MKYSNIMLDIETLGTKPGDAIVQLGVVGFDPNTEIISNPRTWNITAHPDASFDDSTVRWWMNQSDAARSAVFSNATTAGFGVLAFDKWVRENTADDFKVWSKPSAFDVVLVEALYRQCGRTVPWKHWNTRCLRTLIDVAGASKKFEPTIPHVAGYDAEAQAKLAMHCFKVLEDH